MARRAAAANSADGALARYRAKRQFDRTPEPSGAAAAPAPDGHAYLIQKHAARRLHYDLRLQIGDTLKSWAVTKGPSLKPGERRLAVHVEDHPLDYGGFEGIIPQGEYGGGTVLLWDRGSWEPQGTDAEADYRAGKLKFRLHGAKLQGGWMLLRLKPRSPRDRDNWLLIKERDDAADETHDILADRPESVATGRSLDEIASGDSAVWHSNRGNGAAAPPAPKAGARPEAAAKTAKTAKAAKAADGRKAKLPDFTPPVLATTVAAAPDGPDWLHEIKLDGYRAITRIDAKSVTVMTRKGLDWTARVPALVEALRALPVEQAMLDGEIVVVGADGVTDFGALQDAFAEQHSERMRYVLFDLTFLDGRDLAGLPLERRKALLAERVARLPAGSPIQYSDHMDANGASFFQHSCRFGLEGIISKRRDAPYRPGRGTDWVKSKCVEREEFVIGGFTLPSNAGGGIGALLVGWYAPDGRLVYAGKVGTGFPAREATALRRRLDALRRDAPAFAALPRAGRDKVVPVEPTLVAEVEFTGWTEDRLLRHPAFKGLREDKDAAEVTRADQPAAADIAGAPAPKAPRQGRVARTAAGESGETRVAGVRISHPDRVLHEAQGLTKLGLAQYYAEVARWMLPELVNRPLSLLRCPGDGEQGCFFQKHIKPGMSDALRQVPVRERSGLKHYIAIDDVTGLIALVQYGVVEFHPWGSRADDLDWPDRMIFDLDPDPTVDWPAVVAAARELRQRLDAMKLRSFLKTTGGKGLHLVVPLTPKADWDTVKEFARGVAQGMVADAPDRFVATMTKAKRVGKIFIDFFRNDRGATAIAAYAARARPGAPIAAPLDWDELSTGVRGDHFTVRTIFRRLGALRQDPWADIGKLRQTLPAPKTTAAVKPPPKKPRVKRT